MMKYKKTRSKNIPTSMIKWLLILIGVFLTQSPMEAQGLSPVVQGKVDSLNKWVQEQLKTSGKIDQLKLDSMNAQIRKAQEAEGKKTKVQNQELNAQGQKLLSKQGMLGTSFTVPHYKIWKVKRVFVSDNSGHNVLVSSVLFPDEFKEGEKIHVPSWTAESNLLGNDQGSLNYIFEIIETEIKK